MIITSLFPQEFVFCKTLEDLANVQVGPETIINLSAGEIAVIQYAAIQRYVLEGQAELV
jgi:hypothetical protein